MTTLAIDANAKPIQVLRPILTRVVNISGTSAPASAFSNGIRVVRLVATVDCFYRVTGTATNQYNYLPANSIEYIHVLNDDQVSFITNGATGIAYVSAMV